ncbi:MAG: gamma-glutamyltransferase [Gammaproteobacteria bacterium]|nr:gamma-glutamyltransferase [Gammaproteobacteria bacterium]
MKASYNTVAGEDDPMTIPGLDMGDFMSTEIRPSGRATLVPGFMKGVEAGHARFGKVPFADLFDASIRIAEEGMPFNAGLVQNVAFRSNVLSRRPETRAIFFREDGAPHELGDNFRQPALAATLRRVAADGNVDYLYSGEWAEKLVAAVQEEGGRMTMEDLAAYDVIWSDPVVADYAGHQVFSHGLPATGGVNTTEALNILEAADIKSMGHYTESPEALFWLTQLTRLSMAGYLFPHLADEVQGVDMSLQGRLGKGLHQKTIQMLHSILDFGYSPDEAAGAPAFGSPEFTSTGLTERTSIVEGEFDPEVVAAANALGANLYEDDLLQGGWSGAMIDPETGKRTGGVSMVWALTPENDSRPVGY